MLDFLAVILRPNVQLHFVEFGAELGLCQPHILRMCYTAGKMDLT